MSLTISQDEFELLATLIYQECGIALQDDKKYLIESRLAGLVVESGCRSYREFYDKAKGTLGSLLRDRIVDSMTTNETLWFRDESPYRALNRYFLPQFAEAIQKGEKSGLRIWSAACSTGQEPYSISMMVHEFARQHPQFAFLKDKTSILATDISKTALATAQTGRYSGLAMSRGMMPDIQNTYFEEQNGAWSLRPTVRKMIQFRPFNLQQPFQSLGTFDMVFLRNVAIYFSPEFKKDLFQKIASVLNPGGYLLLGTSETLIGYSQAFQLMEKEKCIFYQRKPQ